MLRPVLLLLGLAGCWAAAYLSGAFPWLGYASQNSSSFGAGPIGIIGENQAGFEIGPETFLFFEGQEVIIDYDTEITAGSLWLYVYRPFDGVLGGGASHYVTASGKGTWTMPVKVTDFYQVTIKPSPTRGAGRGWDLSYSVAWGARPAAHR